MPKTKAARQTSGEDTGIRDRIIAAAYECFERYGINKTNVEDIASKAGVSRQTVYNYFGGKSELVENICLLEAVKVNAEVRRRLVRSERFEDVLTDALLLIVEVASNNPYLKSLLQDLLFQSHASEASSPIHQLNLRWWKPFLTRALERGEMATDVSIDEVLSWLTLTQSMIQVKMSGGAATDAELRRLIERFVVYPLLSRNGPFTPPAGRTEASD
jgi:AcrR family transcriptional regulator